MFLLGFFSIQVGLSLSVSDEQETAGWRHSVVTRKFGLRK
jgi:hypothetical protein